MGRRSAAGRDPAAPPPFPCRVISSRAARETASRRQHPKPSSKSPLWERTLPATMSPPSLTPRPEHDRSRRTSSPEFDRGPRGRTWRQWFVPSRVTSAFFFFNTVFWGFMIAARYELAVFAQIDRENLLGWAVW